MVLAIVSELEQRGLYYEAIEKLDAFSHDDLLNLTIKSRLLLQLNHNIEATDIIDGLLIKLDIIDDLYLKLGVLGTKAEILLSLGEFGQISKYMDKASQIEKKIKKQHKKPINLWYARYLHLYGKYHHNSNKYKKALSYYNESLSIFEKLPNIHGQADVLNSIASLYEDEWKLGKAEKVCNDSLILSRRLDNRYFIATSLNQLGIIHAKRSIDHNDVSKALEYFIQSRDYHLELHNHRQLQLLYLNIAKIYTQMGDFSNAEKTAKKALKLSDLLGNKDGMVKTLQILGDIQLSLGNVKKASDTWERAKVLAIETENKVQLARVYNNLGVVNKKMGNNDDSLLYYQKSLDLENELGGIKSVAILHHNIGSLHLVKGDPEKALESLNSSLDINRNLDKGKPSAEQATDLQLIGRAYSQLGNRQESIKYLNQAYEIVKSSGNHLLHSDVLYDLFLGYQRINDRENMITTFKLLDKIANKSKNKIIKTRAKMADGIIKMEDGTRIKDKVEANVLFSEIVEDDVIDIEYTIGSMLQICNYLLMELSSHQVGDSSERPLIIEEINEFLSTLYEMCENQVSHSLLIEILIIQSKLALVEDNFKDSSYYLNSASEIAELNNLGSYKIKISEIINRNEKTLMKFANLSADPAMIGEIEEIRAESYLEDVVIFMEEVTSNHYVYDEEGEFKLNKTINLYSLLKLDQHLPMSLRKFIPYLGLSLEEYSVLSDTVKKMLEIEENKVFINPMLIDLNAKINKTINSIAERIEKMDIKFSFINETAIDQSTDIVTDPVLLDLIIKNLLINAAKFNLKNGFISVEIKDRDDTWEISILNESSVIPKEKIDVIFDKHKQYDHEQLLDDDIIKTGIGIGLHFVRNALAMIDGTVDLYSPIKNRDTGVHVSIKLPKSIT